MLPVWMPVGAFRNSVAVMYGMPAVSGRETGEIAGRTLTACG